MRRPSRPNPAVARLGVREIAVGAAAAFALNEIWENAQAFLFKGYRGFWEHLWACTLATVGDVVIVALIHAVIATARRNPAWHRRATAVHYLLAAIIGIAIAVAVEVVALDTGRWAYDGMPIVPPIGIGLLPILQMAILPAAVFRLMRCVAAPPN